MEELSDEAGSLLRPMPESLFRAISRYQQRKINSL
jgi:hypothetical protein